MRRFSVYMGITVTFVLGVILTAPGEALHPIEDPTAPTSGACWQNCAPANPIEEDEPGWDCRTMGNRVCGAL